MTAADRKFAVSVNGAENVYIDCPSSGDYYSNPADVYLEIELQQGVNKIKLSNPTGDAPNLDCIGISKTAIVDVQEEQPEENPPAEEPLVEEQPVEEAPVEKPGKGKYLVLGIGAVVVALLGAAVVLFSRKK